MTKRQQILNALLAVLQTGLQADGVTVGFVDAVADEVSAGGTVTLDEGDAGDPEVTLGPAVIYSWSHEIEIDVMVKASDLTDRIANLDGLLERIGQVLSIDTTLGGLVDYLEPFAPSIQPAHMVGVATVRGATVRVLLEYDTNGPLG